MQEDDAATDVSNRFGIIFLPPDEHGRAYIGMDDPSPGNLTDATWLLAGLVRRVVQAYLAVLSDRLLYPLAPLALYEP